ncbi:hypothetical protein ABFS82_12G136700 [Erythranthe guttata]|uniref:Uncharacterized protein n=1 Tax=Erythranthe guttata TaxID=4155 RepID=A0A022RHY5_ERYGU|nr:PREDICTED: uncharacterized protein LOC105956647 [Erythranthe guttata]EYU38495.1 hypothetical protein MIMGU_mgv1a014764mg [Erythranthe guttata]|eukprot:XP_012835969.1 PREDICTED: uncharacterized protein LOC105956647 [Erythranthe guttata]
MWHAVAISHSPPCFAVVRAAAKKKPAKKTPPYQAPKKTTERQKPIESNNSGFGGKKKDPVWQCIQNCGACCKLDKGPSFPSPEEVFDEPSDIELYKSLVGEDGWCIHYDKSSRKCSIYNERPYFCRVEPEIFHTLYGIDPKKFNKEACSCCVDTIKAVHGTESQELENFNNAIWSTGSN